MKKLILFLFGIVLSFLLFNNGIKAQKTQQQLNPAETWKAFIGTWQANVGKDSIEVWDYKPYGKAVVINVFTIIKGQKNPLYINNVIYDSKDGKYKGFVLYNDGDYNTWIAKYNDENKSLKVDIVNDLNPETVWYKWEQVLVNPEEWTWTAFNKDGVKQWETKFTKVK
jgi:hypothetical protein